MPLHPRQAPAPVPGRAGLRAPARSPLYPGTPPGIGSLSRGGQASQRWVAGCGGCPPQVEKLPQQFQQPGNSRSEVRAWSPRPGGRRPAWRRGGRGRGATTGQKSAEGRPEPRGGARKDPAPRQAAGCKGLGVPDARLSPASACELRPCPSETLAARPGWGPRVPGLVGRAQSHLQKPPPSAWSPQPRQGRIPPGPGAWLKASPHLAPPSCPLA